MKSAADEVDSFASLIDAFVPPQVGSAPAVSRQRLMQRVALAARAACAFNTVRSRQQPVTQVAPGVVERLLYASNGAPRRAGEPQRVRLLELAAGSHWRIAPSAGGLQRCEWLLIEGEASVDATALRSGSYHVTLGGPTARLHSVGGAWAYLRETDTGPAIETGSSYVQHDAPDLWHVFAPGLQRRLLWRQGSEAALLYRAEPGARVPAHSHGHDEECLMLDGEVFLDDVLLRRGDYQIAPAGTGHGGVFTDTGAVLYAHGDIDLALT